MILRDSITKQKQKLTGQCKMQKTEKSKLNWAPQTYGKETIVSQQGYRTLVLFLLLKKAVKWKKWESEGTVTIHKVLTLLRHTLVVLYIKCWLNSNEFFFWCHFKQNLRRQTLKISSNSKKCLYYISRVFHISSTPQILVIFFNQQELERN